MNKEEKLYLKIFGATIQRRRKMLEKKQEELENTVDFNYKHYSKVERGESEPGLLYLKKIAEGLEIPLAKIIDEVEKGFNESKADIEEDN